MHTSDSLSPAQYQFVAGNQKDERPIRIINREDKGLVMGFFSRCVIKDYRREPTHHCISRKDQTNRFMAEVQAYQKFNELKCPFVPKLLDYSIEERWLCIERIDGYNVLELTQTNTGRVPLRSIFDQMEGMAQWLMKYAFPPLKNKIKDFILSKEGKLYVVDFERYSSEVPPLEKRDFYKTLVVDLLDRIIISRGRKAHLTRDFMFFFLLCIIRQNICTSISLILRFSCKKFIFIIQDNFLRCEK